MGIDLRLAGAILSEQLAQLKNTSLSIETFDEFRMLSKTVGPSYGIHYKGQVGPICASSKGIFLSTPVFFKELQIEVLIFINTSVDTHVPTKLFSWLQDDEALVFRYPRSGPQIDLAWFRGITECDETNWNRYGKQAGFPNLSRSASISIMPLTKWNLANEKGRVNRSILESLESKLFRDQHMVVMAGNMREAKSLLSRIEPIFDLLAPGSEIAAWKLEEYQPHAETQSLLSNIWLQIFGGPYLLDNK